MSQLQFSTGQGRAAIYLGKINRHIIAAASRRRQRHDEGPRAPAGARAPAALGHAPVVLNTLTSASPSGKAERITPLGYKTAVRAMPRVLAALAEADPRRRAANMLADAVERIGSVKGGDLAGTDSKPGVSDGGVTTRIKHAARLRTIEASANGWRLDEARRVVRGPERVLMPIARKIGNRLEIRALPTIMAVCVDGQALDEVLRKHGWSPQSANRKALADALLRVLDDVADALGLGRWDRQEA